MRACTLPAAVALAMLVTGTLDAASSGLSEETAPVSEGRCAATRGESLSGFPHRREPLTGENSGSSVGVSLVGELGQVKPSSLAIGVDTSARLLNSIPASTALLTDGMRCFHLMPPYVGNPDLANIADASSNSPRRTIGHGQIRFDGHGPEWWARQSRGWHRKYNQIRRAQTHSPSVVEAVNLACATYGHCGELWSKARCESHLNHRARNLSSGAAGVYQFLRGTWASTPYGRFDVYSPYANALAAGWMHSVGRGGEWSCR